MHPTLPAHTPLLEHFGTEDTLFPDLSRGGRYENKNDRVYLESVVMGIQEQLRYLQGAPSVQMQHIPPDLGSFRDDLEREVLSERRRR